MHRTAPQPGQVPPKTEIAPHCCRRPHAGLFHARRWLIFLSWRIILANKYDGENAGRQNGNRIHRAGTASPFWLDRFVMSPSPQLGKSGWSGVGNRRWADRLPPGLRIETADSVIRTVTDRPTRIELRMQSSNGQRSGHVTRCFRSASRPGNGACTRATRPSADHEFTRPANQAISKHDGVTSQRQ